MVERCLGQLHTIIMILACNVPIVALCHAFALALVFSFLISPNVEIAASKIRRISKTIPFRSRKRIEWTMESVETKMVDCWMWFKS